MKKTLKDYFLPIYLPFYIKINKNNNLKIFLLQYKINIKL